MPKQSTSPVTYMLAIMLPVYTSYTALCSDLKLHDVFFAIIACKLYQTEIALDTSDDTCTRISKIIENDSICQVSCFVYFCSGAHHPHPAHVHLYFRSSSQDIAFNAMPGRKILSYAHMMQTTQMPCGMSKTCKHTIASPFMSMLETGAFAMTSNASGIDLRNQLSSYLIQCKQM